MRRLLTLAAFLLAFSLVPIRVHAQRAGGGHAGFSGGGHTGFAGVGHGPFSGHSSFTGHMAGGSGFSGSHMSSFGTSRFGSSGWSHNQGWGHSHPNQRDGFRRRFVFGVPFFGYPYYGYDPWWDAWWWDNGPSSYDEDAIYQRQMASEMNRQSLEEQYMRRQQDLDSQDQDSYARPSREPQPAADPLPQSDPATVLVFRDQQHREIHNYAIADGILYNFTASRTEKIPLAVIDIPATIKANDDRGVEFHLPPPPSEGQ